MNIIYVFIGGGLGALSRYLCVQYINNKFIQNFPLGTLFVNSIGSLIIGFFYKTFETYIIPIELRLFIITGFLGGYTTFSTYSLETVQCFMNGNYKQALLNIFINNILCILFVVFGILISKVIIVKA
ncbi:fluoride efflux transporter CrcB [Treponema sp. R6D11]